MGAVTHIGSRAREGWGRGALRHAIASCLLALISAGVAVADEAKITDRKVSVSAFVDAGQIVHGSLNDGQGTPASLDGVFVNRNGVALTYSGTLNDRLHMNIGVG